MIYMTWFTPTTLCTYYGFLHSYSFQGGSDLQKRILHIVDGTKGMKLSSVFGGNNLYLHLIDRRSMAKLTDFV